MVRVQTRNLFLCRRRGMCCGVGCFQKKNLHNEIVGRGKKGPVLWGAIGDLNERSQRKIKSRLRPMFFQCFAKTGRYTPYTILRGGGGIPCRMGEKGWINVHPPANVPPTTQQPKGVGPRTTLAQGGPLSQVNNPADTKRSLAGEKTANFGVI